MIFNLCIYDFFCGVSMDLTVDLTLD